MLMHFHAYILYIQYISIYLNYLELFWLSLSSPPLFSFTLVMSMELKRKSAPSQNPLRFRASTLSFLLFGSMMRMPERTSQRTFLNKVFIQNAESFWWTSLTLTYPMSFIVGVGSHCVTSRSHVHPCWFRSFTPTCMDSIIQYLSFILAFRVIALLSHCSLLQICFMFHE